MKRTLAVSLSIMSLALAASSYEIARIPAAAPQAALPVPGPKRELPEHLQHGKKTCSLPFAESSLDSVPAAKTPGGVSLTLELLAGDYSDAHRLGGRGITIHKDGTASWNDWSCLSSTVSQGLATIVDGRLVLESLTVAGERTGKTCSVVPYWVDGAVYLVPKRGLEELGTLVEGGKAPHQHPGRADYLGFFYRTLPRTK